MRRRVNIVALVCVLGICPTRAILGRTSSTRDAAFHLTTELRGSTPVELRPLIGNRIYGCDDCQLVCPWNKFAVKSSESDFAVRNGLDAATLIELFDWSEGEFERRTEGSAIRRIGYTCWLRNIAVALGNAQYQEAICATLSARRETSDELVREHIEWALKEQERKTA
jgi:epoxyqueuosine reductase